MWQCSQQHSNLDGNSFCSSCGEKRIPAVVFSYCGRCGSPFSDGVRFCGKCGSARSTVAVSAGMPLRQEAASLPTVSPQLNPTPAPQSLAWHRPAQRQASSAVVVWVILILNVVVFSLMCFDGVSPIDPDINTLVRWGADYGPLTLGADETWRMFTNMFVHIGVVHLAMNMYALYSFGNAAEHLLGHFKTTVVYVVSGICGSMTSLAWHPGTVSAGASGAIFGLVGGLLSYLTVRRDTMLGKAYAEMKSNLVGILIVNVVYGLLNSHIDMAAHAGGLVGGYLVGLILLSLSGSQGVIS